MTTAQAFSRWDAADHLQSDADIAAYLEACIGADPGDGSLVQAALADIARALGRQSGARPD